MNGTPTHSCPDATTDLPVLYDRSHWPAAHSDQSVVVAFLALRNSVESELSTFLLPPRCTASLSLSFPQAEVFDILTSRLYCETGVLVNRTHGSLHHWCLRRQVLLELLGAEKNPVSDFPPSRNSWQLVPFLFPLGSACCTVVKLFRPRRLDIPPRLQVQTSAFLQ